MVGPIVPEIRPPLDDAQSQEQQWQEYQLQEQPPVKQEGNSKWIGKYLPPIDKCDEQQMAVRMAIKRSQIAKVNGPVDTEIEGSLSPKVRYIERSDGSLDRIRL